MYHLVVNSHTYTARGEEITLVSKDPDHTMYKHSLEGECGIVMDENSSNITVVDEKSTSFCDTVKKKWYHCIQSAKCHYKGLVEACYLFLRTACSKKPTLAKTMLAI